MNARMPPGQSITSSQLNQGPRPQLPALLCCTLPRTRIRPPPTRTSPPAHHDARRTFPSDGPDVVTALVDRIVVEHFETSRVARELLAAAP